MLAAKLKMNAPRSHTFLEIVNARWGRVAHCTFLVFAFMTNIIVSLMLILGGSATVSSLTGMNTIAACFLIPFGVAIYVVAGGMRATLIADYSHTIVLYCILIAFAFVVYATNDTIGSPSQMWNMLTKASENHPITNNAHGSYLTMRSKSGLIFGVLNIVGNFATVFGDQAYWQRAIASDPKTSVKAFLMGGIAWFGIPLGIATSLGLSAVALAHGDNPVITLTSSEVGEGLPAVKAAAALSGKPGATAILILLFLAVTSACSAELIAVSSIFTYDVYGTYVNTRPSEKQILWVSHLAIVGTALFMGGISTGFNYIGVSMGYLYELMGCLTGCAVVPIAMCITWKKANGTGAVVGCILGFVSAIAGWLGLTHSLYGEITIDTTFEDYPMLTGNLLSIGVSGLITLIWSLVRPCNFDWEISRRLNCEDAPSRASADLSQDEKEKEPESVRVVEEDETSEDEAERADLAKAFRFACIAALTLTVILIFVIPLPLFFTSHVFPKGGFTAWVVVSIIWLFLGFGLVGFFPAYEARKGLMSVFRGIKVDIQDLISKRR